MRAVMLEVPEHLLQERRRRGEDHRDEMWEGVLHMVPQPLSRHQRLAHLLGAALLPWAEANGFWSSHETSVYEPGAPETNYRVPELVFARRENVSDWGVEGRAELVIEIRSPGDETYDKLPFYESVGCQEVIVIDRDTLAVESFLYGEASGITMSTVDESTLRVAWEGGEALVSPV